MKHAAAAAKSLQSCLTLCDPIDSHPPGDPIPGILQGEHWMGCHFLLQCMKVKSESEAVQSYLTLSDPMDCSLQGSSVPGILQARTLEWVAISCSRDLPDPGIEAASPALSGRFFTSEPPGKLVVVLLHFKDKETEM